MGRLPAIGRGPSIKRPDAPPVASAGRIGSVIGGVIERPHVMPKPPAFRGPIGGVIGGVGDGRKYMGGSRGFYKPDLPDLVGGGKERIQPVDPRFDKRPDGGGRNIPIDIGGYPGGSRGFYGPEIPDLGDRRIPLPIVRPPRQPIGDTTLPHPGKPAPRPPKGGNKFNPRIGGKRQDPRRNRDRTRPDGKQRGSRVRPVQDRRTRDFNPNLESFDAKQYLSNYDDLQKAFGTDEAKARQHFIDHGIKEGRVDTAGGGTLKADIRDRRAKTFKAKRMAAAAKRREGFVRGEEGATFDAKQYLANYKDLQDAFGTDEEKARQHYKQFGAKEGRVDTRM